MVTRLESTVGISILTSDDRDTTIVGRVGRRRGVGVDLYGLVYVFLGFKVRWICGWLCCMGGICKMVDMVICCICKYVYLYICTHIHLHILYTVHMLLGSIQRVAPTTISTYKYLSSVCKVTWCVRNPSQQTWNTSMK